MKPDQFRRLQSLFERLSVLPPGRRAAALGELRDEDPEVLAELRAMLAVLDSDTTVGTGPSAPPRLDPIAVEGAAVGPYRLVRKLGEGGMGEVFEAVQEEPVRRRVALKVVKWGLDSAQVLARFQAERQLLAMMEHPNIARVFEAGSTVDGRPYFAMELVEGEPITAYCDRRRLGVRERIRLLVEVCKAVQHAHRKGIIHRDLKPSNILVAEEDETPLPKVIDFGIAKATDQAGLEQGVFTRHGQLIGTPEYMSPEQVDAGTFDVDTRSDVYSLGVILHELLVGDLPLRTGELRQAAWEELRRRIRETETPRPSVRLTPTDEHSRSVAAARRTDVSSLLRQIRDELDWVVVRSLAKDREERYESVSALAADLERFLAGEAVLVGPPRLGYRLRKLARRHRVPLAATTVVLLGLAVSTVVALFGLQEARRAQLRAEEEAAVANRVGDFLVDLFELSDPGPAGAGELTAREILERGVVEIRDRLDDTPAVRARLLDTLGRIYGRLGLYDEAGNLLEEGLLLRESTLGADHPEVARSLRRLGYLELDGLDRPELAIPRLERARAVLEGAVEEERDDGDLVGVLTDLSYAYQRALRYDDAADALERARELSVDRLGRRSRGHAEVLGRLGVLLQETRDWEGSIPVFEEARSIALELLGPDHLDVAVLGTNLGWSFIQVGRAREALELMTEEISISRRQLGDDHQTIADTLLMAAVGQTLLDDPDAAARSLDEARRIYALHLGEDHYSVLEVLYRRAEVDVFAGDAAAAERRFRRLEAALRGSDHVRAPIARLRTLEWLAHLERHTDRLDEAEATCAEAMELLRTALPDNERSDCPLQAAWLAQQRGEQERAERLFEEGVAGWSNPWSLDRPFDPMSRPAFWVASGRFDLALEALEAGLERGYVHPWALRNPDLQPLHDDPRFDDYRARLLERLGLED